MNFRLRVLSIMLLCVNITLLLLLLRLNMYTVEETAFITDCKTTPGKKVHTTKLFTRHLSCKPGVHLLILVTSHAWTGYKRRLTVRETWGTYRKDRNANTNKTWQTFFVVASRLPTTYNKHNEYKIRAATAELRAEMEAYQDIIEGDFEETFYNLPLKLQIGFEWAHFYCNASYIHKTDDDVFLNTKNVFPFLANLPTENVYSGFVQWRAGVHRTKSTKSRLRNTPVNSTHRLLEALPCSSRLTSSPVLLVYSLKREYLSWRTSI